MVQPLGRSWELFGGVRNLFDADYSDPASGAAHAGRHPAERPDGADRSAAEALGGPMTPQSGGADATQRSETQKERAPPEIRAALFHRSRDRRPAAPAAGELRAALPGLLPGALLPAGRQLSGSAARPMRSTAIPSTSGWSNAGDAGGDGAPRRGARRRRCRCSLIAGCFRVSSRCRTRRGASWKCRACR